MKYPFGDPFRTYLEQMLEEQRRFEELVRRSSLYDLDLTPSIDQYIAAEHFAKTIQASSLNVEAALVGPLREFDLAISDQFSRLKKGIEADLQRSTSFVKSFERIGQLEKKRLDDLFLGYRRLEQIADQQHAMVSALAPVRQLEATLASIEAAARLFDVPAIHWSNSLALVEDYEAFAFRQGKAVERDSALIAQRRMRVTELAGELLATSVTATELGAALTADEPPDETSEVVAVSPHLYGPLNQHLGFVYRVDLAVDVDPSVAAAIPTRICELGGVLVLLFRSLCGRDLPSRPGEWTVAQVNLYTQLVGMLERIEGVLGGP